MKKRIQCLLSVVLMLCVAFNLLSVTALATTSGTGATTWDISEMPDTSQVTARFEGDTLYITGSGRMTASFRDTAAPWASVKQSIRKVVVSTGVTNVGAYAFNYCRNLSSVSLPDSLTEIGTYAFQATGIKRLTIPASVEKIGRMIATPNTYYEVLGNPADVDDHAFSTSLVSVGDQATAAALNEKTNVSAIIVLDGGKYGETDAELANLSYGLIAPVKEGCTFQGWYRDVAFTDPCSISKDGRYIVNVNNVYYAKWTDGVTPAPVEYMVSFDSQGGSAVASQTVAENGKAVKPAAPTRSGYTFAGWFTDTAYTSEWDFETAVTENLTLYAKWDAQQPGTPSIPSTPDTPSTSSGGGSSNNSSNGNSNSAATTLPVTTDTTNRDGIALTETTAKPAATTTGGTASATVDSATGDEIVRQAVLRNSENIVIAPEIKGDVRKTEVAIPAAAVEQIGVNTNANLTVSTPVAEVTIPNSALNSLAEPGEQIVVIAERSGSTLDVAVKVGDTTVEKVSGGLTVTAPVKKTTPGTVAVLVLEDGTRQVIRKSTAGEDSISIPLDGSAKVEIMDNSKQFSDVSIASWEAGAVAFASAHELFNGTSETTFSPDLPMSRGMMAVVLHNLENNPKSAITGAFTDVDNSAWYAEGIAWAAEKGIITGYSHDRFAPDSDITREQLAVMLWRYAGTPSATGKNLNFNDADHVSNWAMEAMLWATEKGIINGRGNGILDPTGKATRAQVAQMLKNFMENI